MGTLRDGDWGPVTVSGADSRYCDRCRAELRSTNLTDLCDPCRRRTEDERGSNLPASFYRQKTVARALLAYDFGSFFRIIRGALDLTQEELGLLIGLAQSQVCKIEKGGLPLRDVETVARMVRIFAIPVDLLGFPGASSSTVDRKLIGGLPGRLDGGHDGPLSVTPVVPSAETAVLGREHVIDCESHTAPHPPRSAPVPEPETLLGTVSRGQRLPGAAQGLEGSVSAGPGCDEHAEKTVLLASVQLLTELADDEPPTNHRVGPPDVERLRQHVALFELVVWRIGGAELRHLVTQYIVRVSRLVRGRTCEPAVRIQLNRLLAELHRMAGWMHLHAEDHAAARHHWDAGVRAADRGRNGALVARILDGRSQQLCQLGRYDEALTMIRQARRIAEGVATPAVMAMLIGRAEAWIYAEKGWRDEALAAIGQAQEAYGNARPAEDLPWAQWFDEAQLLSAEGHCLKILAHRSKADARRGADLIARSVEMMPPRAEHSRMLNLPGLASALVLAGDLDEAAHVFRRGMTAAAVADSSEATTRLRRDFRRYAAPCAEQHRELHEVGLELGAL